MKLPVLNADSARFECTFGRGCDGICCRNGRPPVYEEERAIIDRNLHKFLPLLRPDAKVVVEREGFLSQRKKAGQRVMRVSGKWCVFFNDGCVLHRIGALEGDKFRYKPFCCAVFPLAKDEHDRWYVRQRGFKGEIWELMCLDPAATTVRAVDGLAEELALVEQLPAPADLPIPPQNVSIESCPTT